MCFDLVEGGEEGCYGFFVGFLGGCETGFVDAVVDVVVDPFVGGVDVGAVGGGVEVDFLVMLREQVVELVIEHADDFRALERVWVRWVLACGVRKSYLVANNLARLSVEENRDGETTAVVGVVGEVDITQVGEVLVQRVGNGVLARQVLVGSNEAPSYINN